MSDLLTMMWKESKDLLFQGGWRARVRPVLLTFIGDAIAGERERHTLETLLASRIGYRAILLGKLIVTVGYAWGMALVGLLLSLVLVNLLSGHGSWTFYHPLNVFLEALVLSLLSSVLGASAGVQISLRSATVRQARQILSIGTLVLIFGGIFAFSRLVHESLVALRITVGFSR